MSIVTGLLLTVLIGTPLAYVLMLGYRIHYLLQESLRLNNDIYNADMRDLAEWFARNDGTPAPESRRRERWRRLEEKWAEREWYLVWLDYERMYPRHYILNGTSEPSENSAQNSNGKFTAAPASNRSTGRNFESPTLKDISVAAGEDRTDADAALAVTAPDEGVDDATMQRLSAMVSPPHEVQPMSRDAMPTLPRSETSRLAQLSAEQQSTTLPSPLEQAEIAITDALLAIKAAREQAVLCAPLPVTPLYDTPLPPDPRLAAYPAGTWLWQAWRDPSQIIAKRDRLSVPDYHPLRLVGCCDLAGLRAPNEIPLENSSIGEIVFRAADEDLMLRMGGPYETLVIRTPDGMQYPADTFEQNGADVVFGWRWLPTWIRGWFKDGVIDLELCGTGNRCALDPATNIWNCSAAGQVQACVDTIGVRR